MNLPKNDSATKHPAPFGVLLIDDQKAARLLLKSYLFRLGVSKVEEASGALEALRILRQTPSSPGPFNAVFVSRIMKEMNGGDFIRNLRQLSGWGTFPVVMISEDLDPAYARDARALGATDYLIRPYEEATLKTLMARLRKL